MLAFMRRVFIGSWLGRILALLIFVSFAAWGIGDFVTGLGGGTGNAAQVGGRAITMADFDGAYRRAMAQTAQQQGVADPTAMPFGAKREVAAQAMQQLVFQAVVAEATARLRIVVPDGAVRDEVFKEKAFLGPDGRFSRELFDRRIQAAGFTENQLLRIFREQIAATALLEPIRIGARAPAELVRRAYDYEAEQRLLDMVMLPLAQVATPPAPDEATLHRFYDNHRDRFSAPEYRRIKLVLLSPDTIGRSLEVSDADERRVYDEMITRYRVPEKRSVQVLIVPDQAQASRLAELWRGGAGWTQLQAAAPGATPIALDGASQSSIPSPDIGRLAFTAAAGAVVGPTRTDAGWVLLRVSSVTPAVDRSFDQAKGELHDMIGQQRALQLLSARVQQLQDAIAGGGLDAIPSGIGAAAAEGTLDAKGMTPAGEPAPLPGSAAIRAAMLASAFGAAKGDVANLVQGPENSWYAIVVEAVTPSAPLAFVQAADAVRAAWQGDAVRHAAEQEAAALYAQAEAHGGLAAVAAGRAALVRDVAVHRGQPAGVVPENLAQLAFTLKPGTSTMLETPDGFVVATVTGIRHPDPAVDRLGYGRARNALDAAMADDVENSYVSALRDRARPAINAKAVEQVVGPAGAVGGDSSGS